MSFEITFQWILHYLLSKRSELLLILPFSLQAVLSNRGPE